MDKEHQIMEKALVTFNKYGFHGTSTSKIISEAGISNGTLFHYFKTKENLIFKIFEALHQEFEAYQLVGVEENETTRQKLKHIWTRSIQWGIDNEEKYSYYFQFRNSPYIEKLPIKNHFPNYDFLYKIIENAVENGLLINEDIKFIINYMIGSRNSILKYAFLYPDQFDERKATLGFKMFWRGISNL